MLVVGINPGGIAGGSGDQYFVGDFDGKTFTSDDPARLHAADRHDLRRLRRRHLRPWTTTGTAFGAAPATGPLPGQSPVDGVIGTGFADSFNGGDASTGTLTSPPFTVTSGT